MNTKPAFFLNNIDNIIFDMDGVITSEQNYWNAAALTVYELLNGEKYFGSNHISVDLTSDQIIEIRNEVFCNDKLIALLKDRGVNTNWDLAYIVMSIALITNMKKGKNSDTNFIKAIRNCMNCNNLGFNMTYKYLENNDMDAFEIFEHIKLKLAQITKIDANNFARNKNLWNICQNVFQEWYLGDKAYIQVYGKKPCQCGKKGLMYMEEPVIPFESLKDTIQTLYNSGKNLGIATGRPFIEIDVPLKAWGLKKFFNSNSYITYTDVEKAEENLKLYLNGGTLAKPHPYVFLKAIYGKNYSDMLILNGDYDKKSIERTVIIGDAGSDIMAAKAINCKFVAVLTGISGNKSKKYFEDMKSEYILNNITGLIEKI